MNKRLFFKIVVFLFTYSYLHAQWQNGLWTGKQAYNWCFPTNSGITFNTSPPQASYSSVSLEANEGFGSMSDEAGNLLFYSGCKKVWNRSHQVMLNGDGIFEAEYGSSAQSGLTIPKPNSPGIYYIFTIDEIGGTQGAGLRYSEVDMSLDNGMGGITDNKNILLAQTPTEKLTATFHADGESVWVVSRDATTYMSFLVTENGVETTPILTQSEDISTFVTGQMKFSPDGTKLAMINGFEVPPTLHIMDFDNTAGTFSNLKNLSSLVSSSYIAIGIEFSPNNRFVYYMHNPLDADFNFFEELCQLDLMAGEEQDIINSKVVLHSDVYNGGVMGEPQVGPDGRIYFTNDFTDFFTVINFPNNAGFSCGFNVNDLQLELGQETINAFALPNFIQSYFESGILYDGGQCPGEEITFSTVRIPGITDITWNFGDPDSAADNISTVLTPTHVFSGSGTYTVTATIISNGAIQTTTTEVTILPVPDIIIPNVKTRTVCAEDNIGTAVFDLSQFTEAILNGQEINAYLVQYFASQEDLSANIPIVETSNFRTSGQEIFVLVSNNATGCTTVISFSLQVNKAPLSLIPDDIEKCGDLSGSAIFNLTEQNGFILNGQDVSNFKVIYYASEADLENDTPVLNPDVFSSTGQTVFAVVFNTVTGCTSLPVEFLLIVIGPVMVSDNLELTGCSPFDLSEISIQLSNDLNLTYFTSEQDATYKTNDIELINEYRVNVDSEVFIRAEDILGCVEIYTLKLFIDDCDIPKGISPNGDGKNDSFDLQFLDVAKLTILNRYGQQVYIQANYTNQWSGQQNNGKNLPTGTYFYMVELKSGKFKTGWVYVNREVR